jgi:hypothetical protein
VIDDTSAFIDKQDAGFPDGWTFDAVINCSSNNAHLLRLNGAGGPCTSLGRTEYSLMSWHQVVATITGTVAIVYLDGNLDGWGDVGAIPLNTLDIFIGCTHPSSRSQNQNWFNGIIDDVRIYNHALSPTEVQQLYTIESGPRVQLLKKVQPEFSNLTLGAKYQLQISTDISTWTNSGTPFMATNTVMLNPQDFSVDDWWALFFRLQVAP